MNLGKNTAYIGIVIGILIFIIGITSLIKPDMMLENLDKNLRSIFAVLCMVYGAFRVYRAYLVLKTPAE